MNDPLYNHPAWRLQEKEKLAQGTEDEGESEEVGNVEAEISTGRSSMEAVMSEIIKSKFDSTNHLLQGTGISEDISLGSNLGNLGKGKRSDTSSVREGEERLGTFDAEDSRKLNEAVTVSPELTSERIELDPDCTECKTPHRDPLPSELVMYLHALSYKVWLT